MLPSMIPDVTQQFHALPVCVEDQNIDIGLLDSGDLQVDSVGDIVQQQVEALLSAAHPEWKKFLLTLPDSDVQYTSVPPGLVFSSEKMPSSDDESQCQRNSSSPVIPLSVQQEQLDSIDQQAISESDWMVFQHHDIQSAPRLPSSTVGAPVNTSHPQLQAERLRQMSTETTDQTVPFGRHDSMCSMSSSCSDVKRERRSISETQSSSSSSSPLLPTTLSSTHPPLSHAVRRGRPCLDDGDGDAALTDKKQRRREQNRRAATRCRYKRRAEYEQLKKDHDRVMHENGELKDQLQQMVTQLHRLQNETSLHQQHCGLTLPANTLPFTQSRTQSAFTFSPGLTLSEQGQLQLLSINGQ